MAIRLIDAMDSMGNGGYIDLLKDCYIPPKWFSELCQENYTGFTEEDYNEFESNPMRYLKPPIVRVISVWGLTAMKMGVSQEQLRLLGIGKGECCDVLLPRKPGDNERYCYRYTEAEEASIKAIEEFMLSQEKYNEFIIKKDEILREIVVEWMRKHNISITE